MSVLSITLLPRSLEIKLRSHMNDTLCKNEYYNSHEETFDVSDGYFCFVFATRKYLEWRGREMTLK